MRPDNSRFQETGLNGGGNNGRNDLSDQVFNERKDGCAAPLRSFAASCMFCLPPPHQEAVGLSLWPTVKG
jgi:hypothetical protein